jgi:hypothetical protein
VKVKFGSCVARAHKIRIKKINEMIQNMKTIQFRTGSSTVQELVGGRISESLNARVGKVHKKIKVTS